MLSIRLIATHGVDLGFKPTSDKADERDQNTAHGGTDETVLDKPPKSVPERRKDPDQSHSDGTCDTEELDLVLDVVELGRTRRRERVQQNVGALVGRAGGIEILDVGVLDDNLSTGGRVTDLRDITGNAV